MLNIKIILINRMESKMSNLHNARHDPRYINNNSNHDNNNRERNDYNW